MFPNENFTNAKSPLEKNDHPELDSYEICPHNCEDIGLAQLAHM